MLCKLPYEEVPWFCRSVTALLWRQHVHIHQVGQKEQPVALIRKECKQCFSQQLWMHLVYIAALQGNHGSNNSDSTNWGILRLKWQIVRRGYKWQNSINTLWKRSLLVSYNKSDWEVTCWWPKWLDNCPVLQSKALQAHKKVHVQVALKHVQGSQAHTRCLSTERYGYGSQCCAVQWYHAETAACTRSNTRLEHNR
jgi:hypothetical protein